MSEIGAKIRGELRRHGQPYPVGVRRRAVDYARSEKARGVGLIRVAAELGISPMTLRSWVRSDVLAPVHVMKPIAQSELARDEHARSVSGIRAYDVRSGVVVEGLDLDGAIEFVRRLR